MPAVIFGVQGPGWQSWKLPGRRAVSFPPALTQPQGNLAALPQPRNLRGREKQGRRGQPFPTQHQELQQPGRDQPQGMDPSHRSQIPPSTASPGSSSFPAGLPTVQGPGTRSHHPCRHSHPHREPPDPSIPSQCKKPTNGFTSSTEHISNISYCL